MDLPILMYHDLSAEEGPLPPYTIRARQFAAQLDALFRTGMTTIGFGELFAALDHGAPLPPRPVLITFDDGYDSFRRLAVPALNARDMKASVFVVGGEIGGVNRWDAGPGSRGTRALMDADAVRGVVAAGMEVGAHGWAHRNLNACSEAEQREEIFRPGAELERRCGITPRVFSYPHGAHARRHFAWLKDAGYAGAVSIFSNEPSVTSNPFAMRRIYIHGRDSLLRFRLKLSPRYLRYVAWRDGKRIVIS
jgi:peptidoglycan/xylan/chitin deacetylase (PgdA/CDA1 family)